MGFKNDLVGASTSPIITALGREEEYSRKGASKETDHTVTEMHAFIIMHMCDACADTKKIKRVSSAENA